MRALDLYWASNPDWYDYIRVVRPDAPAEAKASFEHYLEQKNQPISEFLREREVPAEKAPLTDKEKIAVYEVFIEDMLHVFQERLGELNKDYKALTEYEKGRWMGYWEILDIIVERKDFISEMLEEE